MIEVKEDKGIAIHTSRVAQDTITFFDKWDDPIACGFIVEWSLEKEFNGISSRDLDQYGIDFISQKGTTYQVKCSTVGSDKCFKDLARKWYGAENLILAYADKENRKVTYSICKKIKK